MPDILLFFYSLIGLCLTAAVSPDDDGFDVFSVDDLGLLRRIEYPQVCKWFDTFETYLDLSLVVSVHNICTHNIQVA